MTSAIGNALNFLCECQSQTQSPISIMSARRNPKTATIGVPSIAGKYFSIEGKKMEIILSVTE